MIGEDVGVDAAAVVRRRRRSGRVSTPLSQTTGWPEWSTYGPVGDAAVATPMHWSPVEASVAV